MHLLRSIVALAACFVFLSASADPAPAQFSAFDFNAPDTSEIKGVRLSAIYGKSGNVTGVDFTIGLSELDNLTGVSFPLIFGANRIRNSMTGVGIGIVNLHEGTDKGVNVGLLNLTNDVQGLNWGSINISTGTTLADVGFVNISDTSTFQLAVFNKTDILEGIQIGLLNCASNGFFPCFPIFNFAEK
jgi:hypothetical protein